MSSRVLHLLDATTPPDAFDMIAALTAPEPAGSGAHAKPGLGDVPTTRVATIGHHSTARLATAAGVPGQQLVRLPSRGWADPTGWRALRKTIRAFAPTHVHAWGIPAAFAAAMATVAPLSRRARPQRLVSLFDFPAPKHLRLLRAIHRGPAALFDVWGGRSPRAPAHPCTWIAGSAWLARELSAHGLPADTIARIRPAVAHPAATHANAPILRPTPADLREELGLAPTDGPILLLGGDGGNDSVLSGGASALTSAAAPAWVGGPRHDLGLWAAAILQAIFPNVRAIVREDPRRRADPGLDRLFTRLPDDNILVLADADYSWPDLLSIADVLLLTPDQPFAAAGVGCMLHAMAAGVPVIATPMESVREVIADGQTGILTASTKPRAIAAAMEAFLGEAGGESRRRVMQGARLDRAQTYSIERLKREYAPLYAAPRDLPQDLPHDSILLARAAATAKALPA